jgi:hypothetical protein
MPKRPRMILLAVIGKFEVWRAEAMPVAQTSAVYVVLDCETKASLALPADRSAVRKPKPCRGCKQVIPVGKTGVVPGEYCRRCRRQRARASE